MTFFMCMTMIIRTGTDADFSLLDAIEERSDRTFLRLSGFEEAINQPRMAASLGPDDDPDTSLFIAEDGEPIGFIHVHGLDDCSHVTQISVVPEAQGKGAGTGLLNAAASAAKNGGKRGLTLITFRDVPWNGPFYARRGFHSLDLAEMGPGLAAAFAEDIAHASRYGTRCAMGLFFD